MSAIIILVTIPIYTELETMYEIPLNFIIACGNYNNNTLVNDLEVGLSLITANLKSLNIHLLKTNESVTRHGANSYR